MDQPDNPDYPADPLAILRAQLDQGIALAPELARGVRAYYDAFTQQGFEDKQAMYLTACQMLQTPGPPPS